MPRGVQSIHIATPTAGARFDLPVNGLAPNMLAAGSFNVVCDATNVLRARNGYLKMAGGQGPQKPLTGGISWEGANGQIYTVVADTENWWAYFAGQPNPWVALTGSAPVGPNDFTQFANMQVLGIDTLFGVNNGSGGLLWAQAGSPFIQTVTGLPFTAARDCFVLAGRLVVLSTVEGGILYPNRVRWSQVNNPFVFPPQAVADLAEPGGGIVAGLRMGNLQAFLYMQGAEGTGVLQTMMAQAGDDATAFAFQEFSLGEGVIPPASVAAIIAVQGVHYYLGQDGHIWSFNGVAPQNFGIPVQSDIFANGNLNALQRSFALYVPGERYGRFFFPAAGADYPNRCLYYSFDFNRWEAPASYSEQFRSGFTGPLTVNSPPAAFVGGVNGAFYEMDGSDTDNGAPIQFNATWGVMNTAPLDKLLIQFAEAFIQQASRNDEVAFVVSGLRNPLDTSTTGAAYLMELSQTNQFQQATRPGIGGPGATYYNWIQCVLQGSTWGALKCLGAYIHVNVMQKGVYNLHGGGPE